MDFEVSAKNYPNDTQLKLFVAFSDSDYAAFIENKMFEINLDEQENGTKLSAE